MLVKIIETIFSKGITAIANFVTMIVTAGFLGAGLRGEIVLLLLSVNIVNLFQVIMGGPVIAYLTPRHSVHRLFAIGMIWTLAIGAVGSWLLIVSNLLPQHLFPELFIISVLQGVLSINQNVLIGKERISLQNILEILRSAGVMALVLVMMIGMEIRDVNYVYYAYIGANGVAVLLGFVFIFRYLKPEEDNTALGRLFTNMLRFGTQTQINNISQILNYRFVYFLIEKWKGIDVLGAFSVAVSIGEALWVICKGIATNQFARLINEKDEEKRNALSVLMVKLSTTLTVFGILALLLIPQSLYGWIHDDFAHIKPLLYAFAPGILFLAMFTIFNHHFTAIDRNMINVQASLIGNGISIISGIVLIDDYGSAGGALTYGLAYFAMLLYLAYRFMSMTGKSLRDFVPGPSDLNP